MRALIVAIMAIVTVSIASAALAQQTRGQGPQRSVRDMMNDMKARYGQTFDECQALATSRGYRLSAHGEGGEDQAIMMFIEGCIMGKQR